MVAGLKIVSSSWMWRNGLHRDSGEVEESFSQRWQEAPVRRFSMGFASAHAHTLGRGYGWRKEIGAAAEFRPPDHLLRYPNSNRLGLVDDPIS